MVNSAKSVLLPRMKNNVRQITGFLLLGIYLAVASPLQELLKLPVLIEHFQEHLREKPQTSVLGFVILHYFSGSPHDSDYERDMQLPFKTLEVTAFSLAVADFAPESFATHIVPSLKQAGNPFRRSASSHPSHFWLCLPNLRKYKR